MKKRTLANKIAEISAGFPVLLLTGPRQVGKTTLLESLATPERGYVTLDDLDQRALAQQDPALFLQRHPAPLIIDEVQYAPELLGAIKIAVDRAKTPGMYWLTGSQKFHLMSGISESLAGRVAIIDMLGLSLAEIQDRAETTLPFLPTTDWLDKARADPRRQQIQLMDIYQLIWRGSYPQLVANPGLSRDVFYNSYVQTYIQRDVRDVLNITDATMFMRFMRAVAARTAQLLNYSHIARDVGVDHKTAKAWLSVLETSGLIYFLYPLHSNVSKRLLKTPKLYFMDTGLCAFLTRWSSSESLEAGAMSGAILETFVVVEIIKSHWNNAKTPYCSYYRDADQKEIGLVLQEGDTLYPVELKKTATPSHNASRNFGALAKLDTNTGHGAVICLCERDVPLSSSVDAIPVGYL